MATHCAECGEHVSAEYARVCADREGVVTCPHCAPKNATDLMTFAAWGSAGYGPR